MTDYTPSKLDLAITLMSHTTVSGILYTFAFILYCLCIRLSYFQNDAKFNRQMGSTVVLASIMILCATINVVLNHQYGRIIYVDYNSLPGGPLGLSAQAHASRTLRINDTAMLVESFLAKGVLVWRIRLIYSGVPNHFSIPIVSMASLLYLADVVTPLVQTVYGWFPLSGTLQKINQTQETLAVMSFSTDSASTIFMTLMIATRLMLIRRKHIELMGKTDTAAQYLGIVAMLVESYALSTAWNTAYIIAYILRNPPAHNFFGLTGFQIQIISYFLLLYRVLSGRAWDKYTQNRLSTLQWQRSIQQTHDDPGMEAININADYLEAELPVLSSRTINV